MQRLGEAGLDGEQDDRSLLAPFPDLPGFLRALLVADGTVTSLLGAYFDEPIRVSCVEQDEVTLDFAIPVLQMNAGESVFWRGVTLAGEETGRQYATAFSLLNPANIQPRLFQDLISDNVGMGEVLRNSRRGSYRRVLRVFRDEDRNVSRTYMVYLEGLPTILITETFDVSCFQASA